MTDDLEKLHALFKSTKSPLTARKIAKKTGTYPATAKRRVEALKGEGHRTDGLGDLDSALQRRAAIE